MNMQIVENLKKLIKSTLSESTEINFKNHEFVLKVDVNDDPNKKGIKIQFLPITFGQMSKVEQNDIAIELGSKLEKLKKYGMRVERDRELKDKTIIGFFVYIEYVDRIIRKILTMDDDGE